MTLEVAVIPGSRGQWPCLQRGALRGEGWTSRLISREVRMWYWKRPAGKSSIPAVRAEPRGPFKSAKIGEKENRVNVEMFKRIFNVLLVLVFKSIEYTVRVCRSEKLFLTRSICIVIILLLSFCCLNSAWLHI